MAMQSDPTTVHPAEPRHLGPSDSSDSASDVAGSPLENTDSDRSDTGERASVDPLEPEADAETGVDRVVDAAQAGLGGGLDQAEEARAGVRDEDRDRVVGVDDGDDGDNPA